MKPTLLPLHYDNKWILFFYNFELMCGFVVLVVGE